MPANGDAVKSIALYTCTCLLFFPPSDIRDMTPDTTSRRPCLLSTLKITWCRSRPNDPLKWVCRECCTEGHSHIPLLRNYICSLSTIPLASAARAYYSISSLASLVRLRVIKVIMSNITGGLRRSARRTFVNWYVTIVTIYCAPSSSWERWNCLIYGVFKRALLHANNLLYRFSTATKSISFCHPYC